MHTSHSRRLPSGDPSVSRSRTRRPVRRRLTAGMAAAVLALPLAAGAGVVPAGAVTANAGTGRSTAAATPAAGSGWGPGRGGYAPYSPYSPYAPYAPYASTATVGLDATEATAEQSTGLALISTTVDFGAGEAAGSGIVLDGSGIVVTNHHVVEGATGIEVTIASTGETYAAELLGTDATKDVAVLRLDGASGLETARIDPTGADPGIPATAVGDAGGDGGALTAASGTVTALHRTITVSDENGGSSRLRNLIEVDADIIPGDSGGALLDDDGDVIGMNVAASSGGADITGYAIPIRRVLAVADAVLAGDNRGSVDLGYDAFLGVQLAPDSGAPILAGILSDGPAAAAGLSAGDTLTALGGHAVTSADALRRLIAAHDPGDTVTVTWTDAGGSSRAADVTLAQAPVA